MIYTTLTNQLVDDQKYIKNYCNKLVLHNQCFTYAMLTEVLLKNHELKIYPTNIIIDEITLLGKNAYPKLRKQFPQTRIFVLGDEL